MALKPESPTIEWKDDAKPLALCMMCDTEFPTQETRCPQCQSALSLVHRCPGCSRVVSAKHLRCPYCSQGFLKDDESGRSQRGNADAVSAARRQLSDARLRGQGRRALWFGAAVFLTVFVLAVAIQRYRPGGGADSVVLGSSFVLHEVVLRESGSSLSPALGKLAPPAVVEITGTQQDVQGGNWFQIQWGQGTAYIPVSFVAPPKGNNADSGYTLLRISLLDLSDPAELGDAASAVKLYRNRYPVDARGEELLWILAEKGRELGLRRRDAKALAAARSAYNEISREHGKHAAGAAAVLANLTERSAASAPEAGQPTDSEAGAAAAAGGPGSWGVYDDKTRARKVMLLDRTEVSVVLSAKQTVKDGEILTGQIARAVVSNGDTVIPGGSPCRVKVTIRNSPSGKSSVELSLVEIQIGGKSHPVEAAPVYLGSGQSVGRSRLSFRLRQSLILAQ
jgi:hypothetical protein